MSRPFPSRNPPPPGSFIKVNGKIRAREVRVIGPENKQLGIMQTNEALRMAQAHGVDLVEIVPNANPPVCRIVDFGKYRYELSKKDKETKKSQHANRVKEIQLSPSIDPHDFTVKLTHAIDFLCEDMKVKVALRFRGREMAHQEFGFGQVNRFIKEVAPWGHPDAPVRLVGRGINVMISPHPRNKRAPNPRQHEIDAEAAAAQGAAAAKPPQAKKAKESKSDRVATDSADNPKPFGASPFDKLGDAGSEE